MFKNPTWIKIDFVPVVFLIEQVKKIPLSHIKNSWITVRTKLVTGI